MRTSATGTATRFGSAVLVAVIAVAVASCQTHRDPRGGTAIAEHIRNLNAPIVADVRFEGGSTFTGAVLTITFRPDADNDSIRAFMCQEAMPYAEAADPPDDLAIVAVRNGDIVLTEDVCR